MSSVKGVVVLARNGDRTECYQEPQTYKYGTTSSTPLGEAEAYSLGSLLREMYFDPGSITSVEGLAAELVDLKKVHVRVKVGSEGHSVFDSTIALLQGLFPPTPKNRITLANDMVVVAPLGGYQYVPVETVEPFNDLSLESWTGCPAFEQHIAAVHLSDEFKKKAEESEEFLSSLRDYVFGRPATLENIWNIYDFMSSQLVHNKTFAYRLPPSFIHHARDLVNFNEDLIFSDKAMRGIGNIAGRTTLHTILTALERISFEHDPLQFLLIGTTYQPFISLLHMTEIANNYPYIYGLPNYTSALVLELITGSPPDARDFVRIKFKNGTDDEFQTLNAFGHHEDIPLTEFVYRLENAVIDSPYEWSKICNSGYRYNQVVSSNTKVNAFGLGNGTTINGFYIPNIFELIISVTMTLCILFGLWMAKKYVKKRRAAQGRIHLPTAVIPEIVVNRGEKSRLNGF